VSLRDDVNDYAAATEEFLDAVRVVTDENIDRHLEEGWSARQVIHHVADSETQSYARLRRLLAEPPGSLIQGYDEAAWAQCEALGYRELAIEHSLAVFVAVRRSSLDVLGRLGDADLERHATHSESGRYTLRDWLEIYRAHPRAHAQQLIEATLA